MNNVRSVRKFLRENVKGYSEDKIKIFKEGSGYSAKYHCVIVENGKLKTFTISNYKESLKNIFHQFEHYFSTGLWVDEVYYIIYGGINGDTLPILCKNEKEAFDLLVIWRNKIDKGVGLKAVSKPDSKFLVAEELIRTI